MSDPAVLKQPGRRYGPAPKPAPKHRQAPEPMGAERRSDVYGHTWTGRQQRQYGRKHGHVAPGGKGAPTPKQRKVRR